MNSTKEFTYRLDRGSKKYTCPSCSKKSFVRYVHFETNELHENLNFGRCDRESKCNYMNVPNSTDNFIHIKKDYKPIPFDYLPNDLKAKSIDFTNNNLFNGLCELFSREDVLKAFLEYEVGTIDKLIKSYSYYKKWIGATVFWYIDIGNKITYGKVIRYQSNCKRDKSIMPIAHSVSKMIKHKEDFNKKIHLFGLNLIYKEANKNKPIALCESEKTCLIMSLVMPEYLWLSSFNISALKEKYLRPIKKREIVLFPDLGKNKNDKGNIIKTPYEKWNKKAQEFNKLGYKIKVSESLERIATEDDREKGKDIADFVLNEIRSKQNIKEPKKEPTKPITENNGIENQSIKTEAETVKGVKVTSRVDKNNPKVAQRENNNTKSITGKNSTSKNPSIKVKFNDTKKGEVMARLNDSDWEVTGRTKDRDIAVRINEKPQQLNTSKILRIPKVEKNKESSESLIEFTEETYTSEVINQEQTNTIDYSLLTEDLENYFKEVSYSDPIKLNESTIIETPSQTINTHLNILKGNSGDGMKKPYLDRLILIKEIINNQKTQTA